MKHNHSITTALKSRRALLRVRTAIVDEVLSTCGQGLSQFPDAHERFTHFSRSWSEAWPDDDYGEGELCPLTEQKLVARGNYPGLGDHVAVRRGEDHPPPPWAAQLEAEAETIDAELASFERAGMGQSANACKQFFGGRYGDGYSGVSLVSRGSLLPGVDEHFPVTIAALRAVAAHHSKSATSEPFDSQRTDEPLGELDTMVGGTRLAFFARQAAESMVPPHSDHLNYLLTAHLGLRVPTTEKGDECSIFFPRTREKVVWRAHKLAPLLQTSFEHAAVNDTPEDRVILYFDLWHPALTLPERRALSLFERLRRQHFD